MSESMQDAVQKNAGMMQTAATAAGSLGKVLTDNRPSAVLQKKANSTGLPDHLKSGIENLSGLTMDDVRVHYNSNKPAQLNAHAFAQGTNIHIASGQEKHLPHEAWHIVQQKQGRVQPTRQMKGKVNVNDDKTLEKEADVMGGKAMQDITETKTPAQNKSSGFSPAQLKPIAQFSSNVIQCMMNPTERMKLSEYVRKFNDRISEQEINEIISSFAENYDRFEQAETALNAVLKNAVERQTIGSYRVNASQYPRVFFAGTEQATNERLKAQFGTKPAKGYDLSYRGHVDAMDTELDNFLPDEDHNAAELRDRYYEEVKKTKGTVTPNKSGEGRFQMTAPNGFPITALTPAVMEHYHAMHYKPTISRSTLLDTQTTRTYEAEYLKRAASTLNIETFRAFFLPPGSNSDSEQELMINTIGASLDVNVPTKGDTIGSGVTNKTVFKHFQKTLELLNADLDKGILKGNLDSFKNRTKQHIQYLRQYSLKGMIANEKTHSESEKGNVPWDILGPMIQQTGRLINAMLYALNLGTGLSEFQINVEDKLILDKLRVLGVMLGVMIKTEKRLLINYALIDEGDQHIARTILTMIANLGEIEQNINKSLVKYRPQLKGLEKSKSPKQKLEGSFSSTHILSSDEIEEDDRNFEQQILTNNCLPEAILNRPLSLPEARRLRLSLLDNNQQIGGFLDADQPVIAVIARQFNLNQNIIIYNNGQIWRRFLIAHDNVLDITLANIPIPQDNAILIDRIGGNHFIRRN